MSNYIGTIVVKNNNGTTVANFGFHAGYILPRIGEMFWTNATTCAEVVAVDHLPADPFLLTHQTIRIIVNL